MRTLGLKPLTAAFVFLLLLLVSATQAVGQTTLVPAGSVWRYLDDGSNQGIAWRYGAHVDTSWSEGPAQLGYGDGDEATVVGYGTNPNNKFITTYFRHSFEVGDPSLFTYLHLRLLRDDGAVVYLNGTETNRSNMPGGTIGYVTLAASTVGGDAEDAFFNYYFESTDLIPGTNVLAVEIHQRSVTSSDISFDLELIGLPELNHPTRKAPYLIYTGDNTEMQVLWQLVLQETCTIEWGLDELYGLGTEETYEYGDDHQHTYTITDLTPSTHYSYRITAREDILAGSFRTAPPDGAESVGFLVYGDTRTYPEDHDPVAAEILSTLAAAPDLQSVIVNVGDVVSSGDSESAWDTEFFDPFYGNIQTLLANVPYQACRGNHEQSGTVFSKYFPYPYVTPHYWSFDYGPAHFVIIDQYQSYSPGSVQYNWIEADLIATTKPWKFFVYHEPGWSAGGHSNELPVQSYLQPLCLMHGVAMAFAGHNHYYARADVDGVQHVTTGGGGAPPYAPNPSYPNIVTVAEEYHFCILEIDGDELSYTVVTAAGDTIDQLTMSQPTSSVDDAGDGQTKREVALGDAFPNPFNPVTTIVFSVPSESVVELDVLNLRGEVVRTLVRGERLSGEQNRIWNGTDDSGREVGSGVYFYQLRAAGRVLSRKMVLLK